MIMPSIIRSLAVWAEEQVSHRAASKERPPALPTMFRTIVRQVASLAQRREIGRIVVAGIVIQMSAREDDARRWRRNRGHRQILEAELLRL